MAGGRFHFKFQVSGFRVEVAGCRAEVRFQVSRLRVQGLFQGFKESGFRLQGCRVVGFRFHVAVLQGCRFQVSGFSFRFKVSGFLVQGSEFQISEFEVCFLLSSPPYLFPLLLLLPLLRTHVHAALKFSRLRARW